MRKKFSKITAFLLVVSTFTSIPLFQLNLISAQDTTTKFLIGVKTFAQLDNFDSASLGAIGVYAPFYMANGLEGLVRINRTHPLADDPEPVLAKSWEILENGTSILVHLREGVEFHDGTPFNADAVKWNVDRIMYVSKYVNTIHNSWFYSSLEKLRPYFTETWNLSWVLEGDRYAYMNYTKVIDDYTIEIGTNGVAASAWDLNRWEYSVMFSPTHYAGYEELEITDTSVLIGTGPYKFEYHRPHDLEGKMVRNENYWGEMGVVDEIIYVMFESDVTMQNVFLSGDLDYILDPPDLEAIEQSDDAYLMVGEPTGYTESTWFNSEKVNITIREALFHAVNYSLALEILIDGRGILGGGILPRNNPYFNDTIAPAVQNITHARKVLMDAGIAQDLTLESTDAQWKTVANGDNPIAEHDITHSTTWDDHADILIEAASLVGIKINDVVMEPGDIYSIVINPDLRNEQLEIFHATQYAGLLGTERQGIFMFIHYETDETFNYANIKIDDLDDLIWRYYTVNDSAGETQEICNAIQELVRPLYLSIDWYQMETYSGILNKWEGIYGSSQNVVQNVKLVDDGGNGGTDLPAIPGFPLEAIGFVGAAMVVGLIFVMKRKTINI